ncbi:hypothetical protein KIH74_15405 [Kineosporia sp. J2-2]|uniref:Uncharacterized protein n=1 Tax=Kineosporia corallincola TaxID=2835133 RepID=A0ABS5TGV3_9ACTN|nr:hypothetical protein [Kineosporia corallincola]MBT0770328.1 hypothetical protein [Kineosporia corallincola]
MRADPAPRTLRPVLPHQARHPDRWSARPQDFKPQRFGWFGRWSRRSRLFATAIMIASLALVGALVISSAQAVKAVAGTNDQSRYGRSTQLQPLYDPEVTTEPGYLPGYQP